MIKSRVFSVIAVVALAACSSSEKEAESENPTPKMRSSAHHASSATPPGSGAPSAAPSGAASGAPSAAPTTTAAASGTPSAPAGGSWAASVPAKPITAKAGDRVWALSPVAGEPGAYFGVVEIDSVQGTNATTLSLIRTDGKTVKDPSAKHAGAPGALFTPAKEAKLKNGEIVIATIPGYHATAAHVVKAKDDGAEIKYVHGDKVKDETITYAVPMATGIAPFAYVAAKKGSSYEEILVAAIVEDQVFGVDEAGNVVKVAKADVKPLEVEWKDRKKGDKVVVFEGGTHTEVTIDTVSVTKWVYAVKVNGAEKRVPFYAVVDKF